LSWAARSFKSQSVAASAGNEPGLNRPITGEGMRANAKGPDTGRGFIVC
jgi:hypothetical protein